MPNSQIESSAKPLQVKNSGDGIHVIVLDGFEEFIELLSGDHFRDRPEYVFRGHRDPGWKLLPSLYRYFQDSFADTSSPEVVLAAKQDAGIKTASIIRDFTLSLRGTQYLRSSHDRFLAIFESQPNLHIKELFKSVQGDAELSATVFETWALGQHHGLFTPLLDWSESPLVSLYFAFEKPDDREPTPEYRAVYALNRSLIRERCSHADFERAQVAFVSPLTRYNYRLLSQRGLFTYAFDYRAMEDWIAEVFRGERLPALFRILIPNRNQPECLRWLNRMGINPQTLFPDLIGFAAHSNQRFLDPLTDWKEL